MHSKNWEYIYAVAAVKELANKPNHEYTYSILRFLSGGKFHCPCKCHLGEDTKFCLSERPCCSMRGQFWPPNFRLLPLPFLEINETKWRVIASAPLSAFYLLEEFIKRELGVHFSRIDEHSHVVKMEKDKVVKFFDFCKELEISLEEMPGYEKYPRDIWDPAQPWA